MGAGGTVQGQRRRAGLDWAQDALHVSGQLLQEAFVRLLEAQDICVFVPLAPVSGLNPAPQNKLSPPRSREPRGANTSICSADPGSQ